MGGTEAASAKDQEAGLRQTSSAGTVVMSWKAAYFPPPRGQRAMTASTILKAVGDLTADDFDDAGDV